MQHGYCCLTENEEFSGPVKTSCFVVMSLAKGDENHSNLVFAPWSKRPDLIKTFLGFLAEHRICGAAK